MNMEQLVERQLAGETEVFGKNRPRAALTTRKLTWSDMESNWDRRCVTQQAEIRRQIFFILRYEN
jgi:hypothetical protein